MDLSALINIVYLLAALTFMLGIKLMCHPESAPGGNLIAGVGMVAAVIVTLMDIGIERFDYILGGLALGAAIGWRLVQQISAQKNPQIFMQRLQGICLIVMDLTLNQNTKFC